MSERKRPYEAAKYEPAKLPALFATIHFRSPQRPDGYTLDEITELNELANKPPAPKAR